MKFQKCVQTTSYEQTFIFQFRTWISSSSRRGNQTEKEKNVATKTPKTRRKKKRQKREEKDEKKKEKKKEKKEKKKQKGREAVLKNLRTGEYVLDILGQSISNYVPIKIPCEKKPWTFCVQLETGELSFVKAAHRRPDVALQIDMIKSAFGVPMLDLQWDDQNSIMFGNFVGPVQNKLPRVSKNNNFCMKANYKKTGISGLDATSEQLVQVAEDVARGLYFASILSISDAHAGNCVTTPKGFFIVDHMTIKNRPLVHNHEQKGEEKEDHPFCNFFVRSTNKQTTSNLKDALLEFGNDNIISMLVKWADLVRSKPNTVSPLEPLWSAMQNQGVKCGFETIAEYEASILGKLEYYSNNLPN